MKVQTLDESVVREIGHAFGYYDDGKEPGFVSAFSSRDGAAEQICGYVRMTLKAGMLYTTSERGEGYIAFLRPGDRFPPGAVFPLLGSVFRSLSLREMGRMVKYMGRGGPGLHDRMKKEKKPHIFVGMVCVRETYQGQGYMRRVMDLAFAEGDRLGVPVLLETDARSKCDKYIHLGMELAEVRDAGPLGKLYDMVRWPASAGKGERRTG